MSIPTAELLDALPERAQQLHAAYCAYNHSGGSGILDPGAPRWMFHAIAKATKCSGCGCPLDCDPSTRALVDAALRVLASQPGTEDIGPYLGAIEKEADRPVRELLRWAYGHVCREGMPDEAREHYWQSEPYPTLQRLLRWGMQEELAHVFSSLSTSLTTAAAVAEA